MKKLITLIAILIVTNNCAADEPQNKDRILFYVDDEAVTETTFREYYGSRNYKLPAEPEQQKQQQNLVANELINIVLLSRQAEKEKLDESYQVKQAIQVARRNILSKALTNKYYREITVTDEELQQSYQNILNESEKRAEYKASYILMDNETSASEVQKKLEQGADFEALAKQYSIEDFEKNEAKLDWFTADSQEKEIAEAISQLEKGQLTPAPVKTRFGWHILRIDDKRTTEVPPLADIRDKLADLIKKKKLQIKVKELRNKATIKTAEEK